MANTFTSSSPYFCCYLLVLVLLTRSCSGFRTFGFDIHHRYSDPVKGILSLDDLPLKGTLHYYATMAHRDRLIHAHRRGLAAARDSTPLTFSFGNDTHRLNSLGFLHYANVSVGTPNLWYIVALDTGSDLFWLPCDCSSCVRGLRSSSGEQIEFNIYSPSASSTSQNVPCDSTLCTQQSRCPSAQSNCPYQISYLSNGTSSTGTLVEDVLHLTTDDPETKSVDAKITFGCGKVLTGSFLDGAAPNGLFGLGMSNISVPSTLAREGYISNSFSMCFGPGGVGRISFGDQGSSDQGETPFNLRQRRPTYNISITQINVGGNANDLEFTAIFDSGTSFTYLNDPAYTLISESFNSLVKEKRRSSMSDIPFEYCYEISSSQTQPEIPTINLIMKGGDQFNITDPIAIISLENNANVYCLALVKSGDVNIIGQNFMTGYRIVFDRERNVLGWTPSNCYDAVESNTLPISPSSSTVPPATAVNPEAKEGNGSVISGAAPAPQENYTTPRSIPLTSALLMMLLLPFFSIII